jgi:MFS family permease
MVGRQDKVTSMINFIRNRISIGILFLLCGLNFATWATRIPDFKSKLALSEAELGTILMGLPIGSLVSLPLAGWLISKVNSRLISVFAVIMYILIIPIIGYSTNSFMLFLVLFFFGMAGDILNIAMNTQVVALEKRMHKIIMSSFHAIFSIGLFLGAILGGYITKMEYEAKTHFFIIAGINVLTIPVFYPYLLPDDDKPIESNNSSKSYLNLGKYLYVLAIIAFCGMLCEGAMADWITIYFKEYVKSTNYSTTIGFSSFALAMVVGRFMGDYLSEKLGIKNVLLINGLLICAGMLMTLLIPQIEIKIIGCFITGLGISTIVPLIYSQAGAQKHTEPAMAIAGVSTIAYIGFLIGPVVIGYLAEFFNLHKALEIIALLGALSSYVAKKYLNKLANVNSL